MTICKYFLQGTCRFGENCKFEHQINTDHSYANSTSILLHGYANKPTQGTSNVDTNTLVKSVVNDMTSAEKGGQWLLSSYAPFKEKPAFPGFEDHSMEEIRYLFYESMQNGTVEQYKQNLQMMLQQAFIKIKALQNPSPDAVNMLKSIYSTPPSSSHNQSPFSAAPTNSVFNNPQQQKSIFGGPTSSQSIFGGANTSPNVFSNTNQLQQQQNVFAGPNSNSIFSGGQNNVFNNQQQTSPNKSIFANSQPSTNTIFGPPFDGSGTQAVFAQSQVPPPFASPFNQQQAAFPPPQQNIFQQNANNQIGTTLQNSNQFRAAQNPNNQFNVSQTSQAATKVLAGDYKPSFQHTANIFGNLGGQQQNPNIFGAASNQTKPNEEFYSKLEELTEEEIKWFQSDDLDVNKIPEKPPTYEMCFKI